MPVSADNLKRFARWVAFTVLVLSCSPGTFGDEDSEPAKYRWRTGAKLKQDFIGFYSGEGLPPLFIGIGSACVMANTSIDEEFQDWYQDSVRNDTTDDIAEVVKVFGEVKLVIPVALGGYLYARLGHKPRSGFGQWGERSLRGYLVGAPTLLFIQRATGSSRPSDELGSEWNPGNDTNGASGHAFVASVAFVSGARMSRRKSVKGVLYFASTLTAWSRINDDNHYLSQAALGWWIGYLAAAAVDRTHRKEQQRVRLTPYAAQDGLGVMATIRLGRGPARRRAVSRTIR